MDIKERIKYTAKEKFYNYGFKNVKTEDIAKGVGISKKTLYEHYNSKEELFEIVFDEQFEIELGEIDEIVNKMKASKDFDFLKELEQLYNVSSKSKCNYSKDFFRDLKIYFPILWNKLIFLREEEFKKSFSIIWDIGIEKGFIRKSVNKQVAYSMHLESINNILQPEKMQNISASSGEIVKSIFEIMLSGILTPKAAKEYDKRQEQ
jgi:TetR/AcrR family transcriptional regulator, cholesterol catabolism regulator